MLPSAFRVPRDEAHKDDQGRYSLGLTTQPADNRYILLSNENTVFVTKYEKTMLPIESCLMIVIEKMDKWDVGLVLSGSLLPHCLLEYWGKMGGFVGRRHGSQSCQDVEVLPETHNGLKTPYEFLVLPKIGHVWGPGCYSFCGGGYKRCKIFN